MNDFDATIIFPKDYSNQRCTRVTISFDNPADILKAADEIRARKKPPLGLKPLFIHQEQRLDEINSAIWRYKAAEKSIPMEWIEEKDIIENGMPDPKACKPGLVGGALVSNDATPMLWHQYQLAGPNHTCDASPPCRKLPPWDVMARTLACWGPEARWATCNYSSDGNYGFCALWFIKPEYIDNKWRGENLIQYFRCARPEHPETCIIEIEREAG